MPQLVDIKVPAEVRDYGVDWTGRYRRGAISTAVWDVPAGLVKENEYLDGDVALVRVSGGTAGFDYICVCTMTTTEGVILVEAIQVQVRTAQERAGWTS